MATVDSRYNTEEKCSTILEASVEHFKEELFNIYPVKKKIPVVGVTSSDINRELGRTQKNTSYQEYFAISIASISETEDSWNTFATKKYGAGLIPNKTEGTPDFYYKLSLTPVAVVLNLSYFTQSYQNVLTFSNYWISNRREGTFQLNLSKFPIDIRIETEPTISMGEKDLSGGTPYKIDTTVTIKTYVGSIYKTPTATALEGDLILVDLNGNERLQDVVKDD